MGSGTEPPRNYIDPGTAGVVFTSAGGFMIAVIAAVAAFFTTYLFRPGRRLLKKLKRKAKKTPLRRRSVRFILLAAIITIVGLAVFLPGYGVDMSKGKEKIIVLGIDAMEPRLVEKMMKEGKLENFRKLSEEGGYSRLLSTIPPETPVAWSAAATGKNPGGYGIFDFVGRDEKTYVPVLKLANQKSGILGTSYESALRSDTFWDIASDEGVKVSVIKWPVTFPPDDVNGRMLSGLGVVDIKGYLNSYSFYTSRPVEVKQGDVGNVVQVEANDGVISTVVYGPNVRSGSSVKEAEVPMEIKVSGKDAVINVQGKDYPVREGGWSGWVRTKFRIDALRDVSAIFKVYLIRAVGGFEMYMTSLQIDPENPVFDISYPPGYAAGLSEKIGLFYTMGMPEDTKAVTEGRVGKDVFMSQFNDIEGEREKMFWAEFEDFKEGVLAFAFDSGDRMQHLFWKEWPNRAKEVEDYYIGKDRFMGELMEKAGDAKIIVFSDHGFTSFRRSVGMNDWLVDNGYMVLKKEPEEGDDGGLFKYVDWNRTRAYSLGFSSIYINLRGREGNGTVEESGRYGLVSEIIGKLHEFKDNSTGKNVVTNAYRREDIYTGDYVVDAPDIIIGFNDGYRMSWQSAVGGLSGKTITDNEGEWIGDHLMDRSHVPAVLFTSFRIEKENPDITDIAPTVLSLLGIDTPNDMNGRSLIG